MTNLIISGGNALSGDVRIGGSKNEVLKLIAASVCVKSRVVLTNVPRISDVDVMLEILGNLGAKYELSENTLSIDCRDLTNATLDDSLAGKLRASIVLVGPFLARFGKIKICYPGGDLIGSRPIDTHLDAFRDLGATTTEENSFVELEFKILKSNRVKLKERSVTATENILLFASALDETIEIENCAIEPEILHLCDFLRSCGANITLLDRKFIIKGTGNMVSDGFRAMPDRIEAGTYITAILATGGSGRLLGVDPSSMRVILDLFKSIGAKIAEDKDIITVEKIADLKPFHISTGVYPEFPSDMQAPLSVLAAKINRTSTIEENLYKNRFNHLKEMGKLGLKYKIIDENHAEIYGPCDLTGAEIDVTDLRAGATAVLAGLIASGETTVKGIEIIERGYEKIEDKLSELGAIIKRV